MKEPQLLICFVLSPSFDKALYAQTDIIKASKHYKRGGGGGGGKDDQFSIINQSRTLKTLY